MVVQTRGKNLFHLQQSYNIDLVPRKKLIFEGIKKQMLSLSKLDKSPLMSLRQCIVCIFFTLCLTMRSEYILGTQCIFS